MTAFGILRHIERRESNSQITSRKAGEITETSTLYKVHVTRIVAFWVTVWTYETAI